MKLPSLSEKEAVIMSCLMDAELYGMELVRAARGRLPRGTVYVTLGRLEAKGYIQSRLSEALHVSGSPRRLYQATIEGRRIFRLLQKAAQ